jgi:uncharacterized protein
MSDEEVVRKTADYVKGEMLGEGSGHDWWHVYRVWRNAKAIAKVEKANLFEVELGALLHDIADWKFAGGNDETGPEMAARWLKKLDVSENEVSNIQQIIREVSFKGVGGSVVPTTLAGKVVQDADRLDAMGAIGIARCFAYGGFAGREIYNPLIKPVIHKTAEEYKSHKGTSLNHFYEKLLLIKDMMNTNTAKQIALKRHLT